ncbi:MAG: STAS domain-containing protein [Planctomycetota bacterium]|jgi:anti-anti-sigma factor
MKIELQKYDDVVVLQLQGEFTGETLKSLENETSNAFALKASCIVLDMTKVIFMDSQTLEYLVDMGEKCRENTLQFKIAGLDETCTTILELTRLLPQFDTYTELTEAVKSFT